MENELKGWQQHLPGKVIINSKQKESIKKNLSKMKNEEYINPEEKLLSSPNLKSEDANKNNKRLISKESIRKWKNE